MIDNKKAQGTKPISQRMKLFSKQTTLHSQENYP